MNAIPKLKSLRDAQPFAVRPKLARPFAPSIDVGELLVSLGRIDRAARERACALQEREGLSFAAAAARLELLRPDEIEAVLAIGWGYLHADARAFTLPRPLIVLRRPYVREAEQFRILRARLLANTPPNELTPLCIVAAGSARAAYATANLGAAFAMLGLRTLVIDAELRRPRLGPLFGAAQGLGLAEVLDGAASVEEASQDTAVVGLSLLPAGAHARHPQDLLSTDALDAAVTRASQTFDMVLVSTTADAKHADSELVLARARSALVVACEGETRAGDLDILRATLGRLDVTIVGAAYLKRTTRPRAPSTFRAPFAPRSELRP